MTKKEEVLLDLLVDLTEECPASFGYVTKGTCCDSCEGEIDLKDCWNLLVEQRVKELL